MVLIVAVVDSDEAILDAVGLVLEIQGWRVCKYSTGESFVDALRYQRPDCIILDPHLPGLSGPDVVRRVVKDHDQIPIIALTACPASKLTDDVVNVGVKAMLVKPVRENTLVESIRQAADHLVCS